MLLFMMFTHSDHSVGSDAYESVDIQKIEPAKQDDKPAEN